MSKIYTLDDYQKAGHDLYKKLHLVSYPVAIRYIKDLSEVPPGVTKPSDQGNQMAPCQIITQSRRWSEKWVITQEDNFCTPSTVTHGWINISSEDFIESQIRQKWQKRQKDLAAQKQKAAKDYEENLKKAMAPGFIGMMTSPLAESPFIPHSIIVMGTGIQMTYIIHALNYEKKKEYKLSSTFVGFGETCLKGALRPYLYNRPEFVLPGTGDRSFCGIQDWEVGMGLPAEAIFYVLENLFSTGRGQGLKFPLRQVIPRLHEKITPGFIFMREVIDKTLKKEKESS